MNYKLITLVGKHGEGKKVKVKRKGNRSNPQTREVDRLGSTAARLKLKG